MQFFDVALDLEALPRLTRSFWEERAAHDAEAVLLREMVPDNDGNLVVKGSKKVPAADET